MTEVEKFGVAYARAKRAERKAMGQLAAAVRSAAEMGVPDTTLAEQAGVNRHTIRAMRSPGDGPL